MKAELVNVRHKFIVENRKLSVPQQDRKVEKVLKFLNNENSSNDFQEVFRGYKGLVNNPQDLDPLLFSSIYIQEDLSQISEAVTQMTLQERKYDDFMVWFDFTLGLQNIPAHLLGARAGLQDNSQVEPSISKKFDQIQQEIESAKVTPITTTSEAYMKTYAYTMNTIKILQEDPTGFMAADNILSVINDMNKLPQREAGESYLWRIISRGAEFGAVTYKSIYAIAQSVISEE